MIGQAAFDLLSRDKNHGETKRENTNKEDNARKHFNLIEIERLRRWARERGGEKGEVKLQSWHCKPVSL